MNAPSSVVRASASSGGLIRWHRRLLGFCLVIVAFELGLFLLVFPWLKQWSMNWVPVHSRLLAPFWMSAYFRGAVSGLGLLNIYVSVAEAARQLRLLFSAHSTK